MTDSATYTQRQITSWRNALFAVFALGGIGIASWAARIPEVSTRLTLDASQVGILLFGLAAGSIVGLTASSHVVASFGVRRTIAVSLIVSPVGLALAGFGAGMVQSFLLAFLGLAIYGAGIGVCDVAMNVSGAANETALGRTIMPIYHAFWSVGTMVGAATGVLAEVFHVPLELHLALVSLLVVVTNLAVVRYILGEPHHEAGSADAADHERTTWRTRLASWREPRTLTIGLIVLGMAFAEGSANDWLSYAMVEGHDTDKPTGALVLGVFLTAMTVGRLGGVKLLDRFGRVPVLRVSALFAAVGLLMLIMVPVVWIAILGTVLWGSALRSASPSACLRRRMIRARPPRE